MEKMNKLSKLFIKAGLIYLAFSTLLGLFIILGPGYSYMHSHFALIGGLGFLIFGLCYLIIPKYSNTQIYSQKLGIIHFWLGNLGLIGISITYPFMRMSMLKYHNYYNAMILVLIFGIIESISIFIFIYNIWKTMNKEV